MEDGRGQGKKLKKNEKKGTYCQKGAKPPKKKKKSKKNGEKK